MKFRYRMMSLLLLLATGPVVADGLSLTGVVNWGRTAELGTLVSGIVSEVLVRSGQAVDKGQVLLRLDPRGFRAAVARADAEIERVQPEESEARRELERAQELYERTVLSDHALELARIAYAKASADLKAAKAARVEALLALERSMIRAPFAARVMNVSAYEGQVVVSRLRAETLLAVRQADLLRATAVLNAEQYESLSIGMPVSVTVAGQTREAEITGLTFDSQREARYGLVVEFAVAADSTVRAGQRATMTIRP